MSKETNLENLEPKGVFHYFSEISKIPRASKKEKKISDWLYNFAKERNLEVTQDEVLNIFIKKQATKGYENYSPVILQGHMDMVWEKNKNTDFDFETQGIELVVKDGFLRANGTTLGGDDGIAVAYMLELIDRNDIEHPALEMIITVDEEDGMTGVNNLDYSIFTGKTMINLDTEEHGKIYVSSAGGGRTVTELTLDTKEINPESKLITVDVKGLSGGHSGAEIHCGFGNANKILGEVLDHLNKKYNFSIVNIDGGDKVNAIPREAVATLAVDLKDETVEDVKKLAELAFENIIKDMKIIDKTPMIEVVEIEKKGDEKGVSEADSNRLISLINELPNGVLAMSKNIDDLVETSINVGVIKTKNENGKLIIKIQTLPRSSVNKSLDEIMKKVIEVSEKYGAAVRIDSSYMSWEYRENSRIRDIATEAFKKVANKDPEIRAIHAGLECGIFDVNIKNLDIISVGPNIFGAHTPEERMEIWSVKETWDWLLEILKNAKIEK